MSRLRGLITRAKVYIIVLAAALAVVALGLVLATRPVSSNRTAVRVTIPQGASARSIAALLSEQRLIRSEFVFVLSCKMSGSSLKLKPGVYEFSQTMSMPGIINSLVAGKTLESWVTIPEGKTLREIADRLEAKQLVDPGAFLRLAVSGGDQFPSYTFTYGRNLEGYLFPDTYLVERGTTAEAVIDRMLNTFKRKVIGPYGDRISAFGARRLEVGDNFTEALHRVLIVASLVEREARVPADRPKIAAVIWNRLAKGMRLEIDATVTYELGRSRANKARVYYTDLRRNTPFNTYVHAGLPPAPICNPGLASIRAAIEPAATENLYYVARPDGSHIFSRTFEQHQQARKAVQGGRP